MSQEPILADVLTFVEKAGQAMHASRELATMVAAEQEKVAHLVTRDVDALAGLSLLGGKRMIQDNEKQTATAKLSTHHGALEVLCNTLDIFGEQLKQTQQTIAMLQQGKGVPAVPQSKQAAANSPGGPFVGARHGEEDQPESWRKFGAAMGV
jgi:hypothetical protein